MLPLFVSGFKNLADLAVRLFGGVGLAQKRTTIGRKTHGGKGRDAVPGKRENEHRLRLEGNPQAKPSATQAKEIGGRSRLGLMTAMESLYLELLVPNKPLELFEGR